MPFFVTIVSRGLGVGIAAESLIKQGVAVTITEIDPAVYHAARQYFGLSRPASVNLADAALVVQDRASAIVSAGRLPSKRDQFDFVVHDCFTGGSVPAELFTREFWWDLALGLKTDGVVVVVSLGHFKRAHPDSEKILHKVQAQRLTVSSLCYPSPPS